MSSLTSRFTTYRGEFDPKAFDDFAEDILKKHGVCTAWYIHGSANFPDPDMSVIDIVVYSDMTDAELKFIASKLMEYSGRVVNLTRVSDYAGGNIPLPAVSFIKYFNIRYDKDSRKEYPEFYTEEF